MWKRLACAAVLVLVAFCWIGFGSAPSLSDLRLRHSYRLTLVEIGPVVEDSGCGVAAYVYVGKTRTGVSVNQCELPVVLFDGRAPAESALELWVVGSGEGKPVPVGEKTLSVVLPYPGPEIERVQTVEETLPLYIRDESEPVELTLTFELEFPRVATPEPGTAWDYLVITDSSLIGVGERYAAHLEADLGVTVRLHNEWRGGQESAYLLERVLNDEELRELIREAEVITYAGNAKGYEKYCANPVGNIAHLLDAFSPENVAAYKADLDAIIEEIIALRAGQDTIIHAMDGAGPFIARQQAAGVLDLCLERGSAFNAALHFSALEHNVHILSVSELFYGASGREDPRDKSYIGPDGLHPSEKAQDAMADLLRSLGYEYTIP